MPWRELGPVQSGGRIVDIAVNPNRPQEYWLASASGGVWHTDQRRASRSSRSCRTAYTISIGDLAVAPSATRRCSMSAPARPTTSAVRSGATVCYRSDDSGKTWKHWVGLDGTDHIGRIVVHPDDPRHRLRRRARRALLTPTTNAVSTRPPTAARSWQPRAARRRRHVGVVDVVLHPQKPDVVFAATYERRRRAWNFEEGGHGLAASTVRQDGGKNWKQLDNGLPDGKLGRIGLELLPAATATSIYACHREPQPASPASRRPQNAAPSGDDERDGGSPAARSTTATASSPKDRDELIRRPRSWPIRWRGRSGSTAPNRTKPRIRGAGARQRAGRRRGLPQRRRRRFVDGARTIPRHVARRFGPATTTARCASTRTTPDNALGAVGAGLPAARTAARPGRPAHVRRGGSRFVRRSLPACTSTTTRCGSIRADSQHCLLGNDGGIAVTLGPAARTWDHLTHLPILQFYAIGVDRRHALPRSTAALQDNGTWGFPIHGATSFRDRGAGRRVKISGGDGFYVGRPIRPTPTSSTAESQFGGMLRSNLRTGARRSIKPSAARRASKPLRFNWMHADR